MANTIVVGIDGTSAARMALDKAVSLADGVEDAKIVLVSTHDRPPDFSNHTFMGARVAVPDWPAQWTREVEAEMEHLLKRVRLAGIDASCVYTRDDPVDLVLNVARDTRAATIVVPDDRMGFLSDLVLRSTTRRLLRRRTGIPVVVVSDR